MKLQPIVSTDAVVKAIDMAKAQASHRAASGSQPMLSKMPMDQAIDVAKVGGQAARAVYTVVGTDRYDAISKL